MPKQMYQRPQKLMPDHRVPRRGAPGSIPGDGPSRRKPQPPNGEAPLPPLAVLLAKSQEKP